MATALTKKLRTFDTPEWQNAFLASAIGAVVVLAIVAGDGAPTGLEVVDDVWIGILTATVAFFAGYARRWTWFLPAGAGGLLAADRLALACAAGAILLGFVSAWTGARSRALAALAVGLGMAALQNASLDALPVTVPEAVRFHGLTAVIVGAATVPVMASGYRLAGRTARHRIRQVAGWAGVVVLLALAGGAIGVLTVAQDLTQGTKRLDEGVTAARAANDSEAALRLGEASRHLHSAESTLTSWFVQPAHALPFVGPNIRAVSALARDTAAATRVSSAAARAAELDNLRFEDGRLDPRRIEGLVGGLQEVSESAQTAETTAGEVDSPWLVGPVRNRLDRLQRELSTDLPSLEDARKAVEVAGPMIGGEGDRRYLVLFTTPVEGRGRTGFPGNYAELTFQDGKLDMPVFGRITELEQAGDPAARTVTATPDYLARYSRFEPELTWRNITMSPDFPSIARVAMDLYPQSGGREVDGVLSVDPTGLAALMRFTGPVQIDGVGEISAENVESFLHLDQYVKFADAHGDRVDFLEDVAEETFNRLTQANLPEPSEVIDVLAPAVKGNHIQFITKYLEEVGYLGPQPDGIGANGALAPQVGDTLAVTTTNAGGNKIDAFLSRTLDYDVTWDPGTGSLGAKATVTLRNAAPSEGLPDYVIGNSVGLPPGYNRSFVTIYSPWPLDEARLDGQAVGIHPERELDRFAYSLFVDIPPGESVVIELDLTGVYLGEFYVLNMSPAPLVSAEQASVTLTVGGERGLVADGPEGWGVDGRSLRWEGLLNEPRTLAVHLE